MHVKRPAGDGADRPGRAPPDRRPTLRERLGDRGASLAALAVTYAISLAVAYAAIALVGRMISLPGVVGGEWWLPWTVAAFLTVVLYLHERGNG